MSKRVAVYARVSTTRQAENDISIPDQLAHAKRYCQQKNWQLVREFIDAGASARDDKRFQFQRLMEAACTDPSPYDVILIHSQSRLFRNVAGYVMAKRRLESHGVMLVSMTQDFGEGSSADFAEVIIAAADEFNSAETAKHVTRTMLENARQGFWNGSKPPLGYRTVEVEKRGQRSKKKLEIEPKAAELVLLIFKLFRKGDGARGPMGIKDIVTWLNGEGFKTDCGGLFYASFVHDVLRRETYAGTHYYNRMDSRTRKIRPKEEWIAIPVPPIISETEFKQVQERLHDRRPSVTAPRISNSPVLLTGIAVCESCGGQMMLGTGKGTRYRYYVCANHRLKGKGACPKPLRIPMAELDSLVIGALTDQLMTPDRLTSLLREVQRHRREIASDNVHRRTTLRKQLRETEAQLQRLYAALGEGLVTDTASFQRSLQALEAKRTETERLLLLLNSDLAPVRQAFSNQQAATIAATLKRKLLEASPPLQRSYVRGLVSKIVINKERAIVSGPSAAVAAAMTSPDKLGEVRTFDRKWRTRSDSNARPPDS